jgi:hypothetical protein
LAIVGAISEGLGWFPILCNDVLLTIRIDQSNGKRGHIQKILWKFGGLMVTGN